jgi:hypothetical protein
MDMRSFVETELQFIILRKIYYILADFSSVSATNLIALIKGIFRHESSKVCVQ